MKEFDKLSAANALKAAGLPAQQARAVVETVGTAVSDTAVTKADVQRMDERFDRVDERFDRMDERLDRMDERLDRMDEQFKQLETRIERRMDLRFEALEARLETRFAEMDARFASLEARMTWRLVGVLTVLLASHAITVAILLQALA